MNSSFTTPLRPDHEPIKPGFRARIIYAALKVGKMNEKLFDRLLEKPSRGTKAMAPKKFHRKLALEERSVDGFRVLTIRGPEATNHHIILLHGGAYTAEAMGGHRTLMEKLVLQYHFTVSFIDYPLAPEYDASICHDVVLQAFIMLTETCKGDIFHLVGDSAGGGLALAFLQKLRDKQGQAIPRKNVLLSPWLDVSMSNPDIDLYRGKDVLLHVEGLKACGKLYAGNTELKDPMVSPIFGNLEHISNIKVFVSSHELFYPDCKLLAENAKTAEGTDIELRVKEKMVHDWAILPIRERDETIAEIAAFLLHAK